MKGNRMKALRKNAGITQSELGKKLGVVKQTISSWENNISEPNNDTLILIANLLNCTTEYLLGIDCDEAKNTIRNTNFFSDNWDEYQTKLLSAIKESNLSEKEYESLVGIPYNEVPTVDDLIKISNVLSISIDYLLGVLDCDTNSNENNVVDESLSDREQDILSAFRYLDSDNKDIMVGELKKLLKEQKYESVAADAPVKEAK